MGKSTARILPVLAAALVASAALAADRTYDKRLEAPAGGHLTFNADVGAVSVVGRDIHQVVVHADLEGSESFLDSLHIDAEQTPSGVTITARRPHDSWLGWLGLFSFNFGSTRVDFTIEVPRDYPVELRTSGGGIDVRDLNASANGATSGGGIVVQNVTGTVDFHTSGGSIEGLHLQGPAKLDTSGGGIEVTDSTGDLDLDTSGGSIVIQNDDGKVRASTSGGGIRAELRSNQGINLATSGGSINVLLPQDTHATIEAGTSGGGVSCDLPISMTGDIGHGHLRGTIGGGGAPIYLHTSGGSIHIGPLP